MMRNTYAVNVKRTNTTWKYLGDVHIISFVRPTTNQFKKSRVEWAIKNKKFAFLPLVPRESHGLKAYDITPPHKLTTKVAQNSNHTHTDTNTHRAHATSLRYLFITWESNRQKIWSSTLGRACKGRTHPSYEFSWHQNLLSSFHNTTLFRISLLNCLQKNHNFSLSLFPLQSFHLATHLRKIICHQRETALPALPVCSQLIFIYMNTHLSLSPHLKNRLLLYFFAICSRSVHINKVVIDNKQARKQASKKEFNMIW